MSKQTVTSAGAMTAEHFAAFYENPDLGPDVFTPDGLYDANVPSWRFQIQGPDRIAEHVRRANPSNDIKVAVRRSSPTLAGWVAEIEFAYTNADSVKGSYRALLNAELTGGKISELTLYCTGMWTEETRARHAAEVTLIRP